MKIKEQLIEDALVEQQLRDSRESESDADAEEKYYQDHNGQVRVSKGEMHMQQQLEKRLPNGNIPCYACGPLKKERYVNPKIETELVEFKDEIEEKFHASDVNKLFVFPRMAETMNVHQSENSIDFVEDRQRAQLIQQLNKISELDIEAKQIEGGDKKNILKSSEILLRKDTSQDEVIIIDQGKNKNGSGGANKNNGEKMAAPSVFQTSETIF